MPGRNLIGNVLDNCRAFAQLVAIVEYEKRKEVAPFV
jgi:hypothetical protein